MDWTEKTWKKKLLRSQNKGDKKMKQVMEHYGPALIVMVTFVLLGGILVYLLKTDGIVATQFQTLLTNFFTKMSGLVP